MCLLHEIASELGMSAISVIPESAFDKGIIARVSQKLSEEGLNILQAFAEYPYSSLEPKIIFVVEDEIPARLITQLKKLPRIRSITMY